ncbi:unnamed protein product [Leuciscus chuanchicus]
MQRAGGMMMEINVSVEPAAQITLIFLRNARLHTAPQIDSSGLKISLAHHDLLQLYICPPLHQQFPQRFESSTFMPRVPELQTPAVPLIIINNGDE